VSRLWLYALKPAFFNLCACSGVSIPSVVQTKPGQLYSEHPTHDIPSMPMPLTSVTIFRIFSNPLFFPSSPRQAAPMQKRVEPLALAFLAASRTGSISTRREALVDVLCFDDCEQYEQSSVHPPAVECQHHKVANGGRRVRDGTHS
jgi:hypothetical protein